MDSSSPRRGNNLLALGNALDIGTAVQSRPERAKEPIPGQKPVVQYLIRQNISLIIFYFV